MGKWPANFHYYYFLEDIVKFQDWSKKNLTKDKYIEWQKYLCDGVKEGARFIWTNNYPNELVEKPFDQNNKEIKVANYFKLENDSKSIMILKKGLWNYWFIAIDNKQIDQFYNPEYNDNLERKRNILKERSKKWVKILSSIR
jgi:hypothetical protein